MGKAQTFKSFQREEPISKLSEKLLLPWESVPLQSGGGTKTPGLEGALDPWRNTKRG